MPAMGDFSVTVRRSHEKLKKSPRPSKDEFDNYPAWYVDLIARSRYGTDVPTLWSQIDALKKESADRDREYEELQYRCRKVRHYYKRLYESYERLVASFWDEKRKCKCGCYKKEVRIEKRVIGE